MKRPAHLVGREVSVCHVVDLHHRGQRATSEARDLFYGEVTRRVGVLFGTQVQMLFNRLLNVRGAADVTRGAVANAHAMLPRGLVAELCVKRRDAEDRRRGDPRDLTDVLQRFGRQVVVVLLDVLQDRHDSVRPVAVASDRVLHRAQIDLRHGAVLPMQTMFVSVRM